MQILTQMGVEFETIAPDPIDESSYIDGGNLEKSICALAVMKAQSVAVRYPAALVVGADTVVVKGTCVFGKPADRGDARSMLVTLANARHTVVTGIALLCAECAFSHAAAAATEVFFREIAPDEIDSYLETGEYRDKAGAYAIQGRAMAFVDKIMGCYYNVVGLPVSETIYAFKDYLRTQE